MFSFIDSLSSIIYSLGYSAEEQHRYLHQGVTTMISRRKTLFCTLAAAIFFPSMAMAASAEDFYKEKNMCIVVGFSAGGGFDTYA